MTVSSRNASYERSRTLLKRATRSLPHGVSSPFRAVAPVPLYFETAKGARLTDADGNVYIDFALAWGPLILGHAHPVMVEALVEAAAKPHIYGAQHELEPRICEQVQQLVPCAERVALTSSGSEAVQLAFRLARARTSRELILKFEGHYHGWMDSALLSYKPAAKSVGSRETPATVPGSLGQLANAPDNVVTACWNSLDLLEATLNRHRGRIAAVVMEPVLCNSGCLMPEQHYLEGVRALCDRHGALLIFDEVITGFRIAAGGAQEAFGVIPDIATLGKALGGGVPISAVAGRAEIMEMVRPGCVAFGGTFNGNPLSLAGASTCLDLLALENGAALDRANRSGARIIDGIRLCARSFGIDVTITGFGAAFAVHFTRRRRLVEYRDTLHDKRRTLAAFLRIALDEGLYLLPDGRFYVSAAHSDRDVDDAIAALGRAFQRLAGSA